MSVGYKTYKYVEEIRDLLDIPLKGTRICCMGHLNTRKDSRDYFRRKKMKKAHGLLSCHFDSLGADCWEIDINGGNGYNKCLVEDLGRVITNKDILGTFDLLVDGGTAEHIDSQVNYWINIFNLLKIGGTSIHFLPYRNSWDLHCTWRYDMAWLDKFIAAYGYELVDWKKNNDYYLSYQHYPTNDPDRRQLCWAMRKTEKTAIAKIQNPYYDPQGHMKDKRTYERFIIPVRGNDAL